LKAVLESELLGKHFLAEDDIEVCYGNIISVWLFGLMY
jgi:hypothetical protein